MNATSSRSGGPPPTSDGRVARGERNRRALVDAMLELLESGVAKPTARQIADQAGLSLRTVFGHFDDLEGLYAAIAERQGERYAPLYAPIPASGTLAHRLDLVVERRAELFEQVAPVRRATLLVAPESPELTQRLHDASTVLRRQVALLFAEELTAAGPARPDLLAALDSVTAWETWDGLRRGQGLSVAASRRVVRLLVGRLLDT